MISIKIYPIGNSVEASAGIPPFDISMPENSIELIINPKIETKLLVKRTENFPKYIDVLLIGLVSISF